MNAGFLLFEVRRVVRVRKMWIIGLLLPTVLYIMQAALVGDSFGEQTSIDMDKYLLSGFAAFGAFHVALNVGARVSIERGSGWHRQLRLTPLPAASYLVAKLTTAMVVALPTILVVLFAGAVLQGVRLPIGGWLYLALAIWIGTLPFALLGVFIGQIASSDSVQALVSSSHMLLGLLGGALFPAVAYPGWMQAVSMVLPSRWLVEVGHGAYDDSAKTGIAAVILFAWTAVLAVAVIRRYLRDSARA